MLCWTILVTNVGEKKSIQISDKETIKCWDHVLFWVLAVIKL